MEGEKTLRTGNSLIVITLPTAGLFGALDVGEGCTKGDSCLMESISLVLLLTLFKSICTGMVGKYDFCLVKKNMTLLPPVALNSIAAEVSEHLASMIKQFIKE
jgi:hypothetical protein